MKLLLCLFALVLCIFAKPLYREINPEELGGFYEGDMEINPDEMKILLRNGKLDESKRWGKENGIVTVPYEIRKGFFENELILLHQALGEWPGMTNGCFQFRAKTPSDKAWVYFERGEKGCSSYVGKNSSQPQRIHYGNGCISSLRYATIHHEQMHALGFHHEQSRSDRDDYVIIHEEHIKKRNVHNFHNYDFTEVSAFGVPYDYLSVMHYSQYAFNKGGDQVTIETIDPKYQDLIGQRISLSDSDITKLMRMYFPDDGGENHSCV